MNRIYRIVWRATAQSWVVASELARGRVRQGTPSGSSTTHISLTRTLMASLVTAVALGSSPVSAQDMDTRYDWTGATDESFINTDNWSGDWKDSFSDL